MPLVREIFETPHDRPPKWVLMLTAYLDESGHEAKGLVVLAGFLGNEKQWSDCETAWQIGLGKKRAGLHTKELRFRKNSDRDLLARLGPIPHQSGLRPVLCAVNVADYDDLVVGRLVEKLAKGYYICLTGLLFSILQGIPADETVKIVLERQTEYATRAMLVFDSFKDHHTPSGRSQLASIETVRKDESLLTQPADYLAFALAHLHRDRNSRKSEWCTPILQNLKPAFGNLFEDKKKLRAWIQGTIDRFPTLMKRWEEYD